MTTLIILGVLIIIVAGAILIRRQKLTRKLAKLRADWGRSSEDRFDIDLAELYFNLHKEDHTESSYRIDDATWRDLDMDAIYGLIDRSISPVGSQCLYDLLRHPELDKAILNRRRKLIGGFASNDRMREQVQLSLLRLAKSQLTYLPDMLWGTIPTKPLYSWCLPVMSLFSTMALALAIGGHLHFAFPVMLFFVNLVIRTLVKRKVDLFVFTFAALGDLLAAAKRISKLRFPELEEIQKGLSAHLKGTGLIAQSILALQFRDDIGISEYLNIYFLWDISGFYLALNRIKRQLPQLRVLYEMVGRLDALISVASFQVDRENGSRPSLERGATQYRVEGIYNPLLEAPQKNSFELDGHTFLITGSNMAGKTTFLKTIGVNAVLAQTIDWTMAELYEGPFVRVISSIGREDSLVQGKSYYLAEIESILQIVNASQTESVHLFVMDEIYRGTNSVERLAASTEVLDFLANDKDFVLVATHDLKLSDLLGEKYHNFNFRENVEAAGLSFDYILRPGVSTTRNAITLLGLVGYPNRIVDGAMKRIESNDHH